MNDKMCDIYFDKVNDIFWLRVGRNFIPIQISLWCKPQNKEYFEELLKKVAKDFH